MIVPTNRLILENWVPKKLNALIKMPEDYDFSELCNNVLGHDEVHLENVESP